MKVVTFGETLFRLATLKGERLLNADHMNFYLGGTELNIAANLKTLGVSTSYVSSFPDRMMGDLMRERIEKLGVDISHCETIPDGRAGWYIMETGAAPRPDIVYNRYASSIADLKEFNYDWEKILNGSHLFHTSGVAAGLSRPLTLEVKKAMTTARSKNILVSYDFNYRKNIWSIEDFIKYQKELLPLIDILFCAESDLELFFGKSPTDQNYKTIFEKTQLKYLVINQRSSDDSEYGIKVVSPTESHESKKYKVQSLDRIGVGDSMAAGFIASYLKNSNAKEAVEWAALAGALKYGIAGDMALLKEKEILSLLESGPKGIIR